MKRTYCDRCDYDVTENQRRFEASVSGAPVSGNSTTRRPVSKDMDLCVDCYAELQNFVLGKAPTSRLSA